jgi:hypothetical protein
MKKMGGTLKLLNFSLAQCFSKTFLGVPQNMLVAFFL